MGSMTHDYEGVETRAVTVIEDGVLRDVLMSRTPRADREQSTGHARGMAADRFEAMPTQVHITPHKARSWKRLRRQALSLAKSAGLSHVLIVKRLSPPSMEENLEFSVTGDEPMAGLTTPTEVVKLYADGREEPVRGLRFVGADRRSLRVRALYLPRGAFPPMCPRGALPPICDPAPTASFFVAGAGAASELLAAETAASGAASELLAARASCCRVRPNKPPSAFRSRCRL